MASSKNIPLIGTRRHLSFVHLHAGRDQSVCFATWHALRSYGATRELFLSAFVTVLAHPFFPLAFTCHGYTVAGVSVSARLGCKLLEATVCRCEVFAFFVAIF